jgi:hypothetical protein
MCLKLGCVVTDRGFAKTLQTAPDPATLPFISLR